MPRSARGRAALAGTAARARSAAARLARSSAPGGRGAGETRSARAGFARTLGPQPLAHEAATVTRILYGRLSEQDIAATEQLVRDTPGAWEHYFAGAERAHNHDLLLALGMWLGSELLSERTGLIRAEPARGHPRHDQGRSERGGGLTRPTWSSMP